MPNPRARGEIEFRDVVVQYSADSGPVINHLNLDRMAAKPLPLWGASAQASPPQVNLLPASWTCAGAVLLDGPTCATGTCRPCVQFAFVSQHVVMPQ